MIDSVKVQPHIFVTNSAFGAIIGVGAMFKNFFRTYLYGVQPHLLAFNLATLGPLLHFFVSFWAILFLPFGATLESGSGSKRFSEPTNANFEFWF